MSKKLYVKDQKTGEMVPYDENRILATLKSVGVVPEMAAKAARDITRAVRDAAVEGVVTTGEVEKITVDYAGRIIGETVEFNRKLVDAFIRLVKKVTGVEGDKKK